MAIYGENDLCDLAGQIFDALGSLLKAGVVASHLAADSDGMSVWPAMEDLAGRLDSLATELAELPGAEIAEAIKQDAEWADGQSGQADAAPY